MASPPTIAILVRDLDRSLRFYVEQLDFTLAERLPDTGHAVLVDPDGDPLPVAGPSVGDVKRYLAGEHRVLAPGDTPGFGAGDLDMRRAALERSDVERIRIT